jgi:hypothetical protein
MLHIAGKLFKQDPSAYAWNDGGTPVCEHGNFTAEADLLSDEPVVYNLPWKLVESVCETPGPSDGPIVDRCSDDDNDAKAYAGYIAWCAPQYGVNMTPKKPIQLVTGALSTLGGLWIVLILVCFTILWPAMNAAIRVHHQNTTAQREAAALSLQQLDVHSAVVLREQLAALQQQVQEMSAAGASKQV